MATQIQHTVGGKVLITSGVAGLIARSCCCTTPNPCGTCYSTYRYRLFTAGGTTASTVQTPVPCPSVRVTVTADLPPVWQASTAYAVSDWVRSSTGSPPYTYRCTTAGTSGLTEPTWGPLNVNDNTVVWQRGDFSISWVGETWQLPEESGQTRTVCPDDDYEYLKEYYKTTFGFNRAQYRFIHEWSNNPVGNRDLLLRRNGGMNYQFKYNPFPVKVYYASENVTPRQNVIEVWNNNTDWVVFYQTYATSQWLPGTVTASTFNVTRSDLGIITSTPYPYPRFNNFKIPDAFFSSVSLPVSGTGGGTATFTWVKGEDWP